MVIMVAKWLVGLQWWLLVQLLCVTELLSVILLHILILLWHLKVSFGILVVLYLEIAGLHCNAGNAEVK